MELQLLEDLKRELINGYVKKRHPFRYFTLATLHNGKPRQRTVVLRKLLDDFTLLMYTDKRSFKVEDILNVPDVSALFYHPKKLMQLKMEGHAELITDTTQVNTYWKAISENSKKDYITTLAPGTTLKNPDHVEYNAKQAHFCAIIIIPTTIEYLQLKRPNHLRLTYLKTESGWDGKFVVP